MKNILDKFIKIESELSEEKGEFNVFALFLRENSADKWDLLVSSDWINENKSDALQLIAKKVQEKLNKKELMNLSRIVMIDDDNPDLEAFYNATNVEYGKTEIENSNFFGLEIKRAFIITSRRKTAEAS